MRTDETTRDKAQAYIEFSKDLRINLYADWILDAGPKPANITKPAYDWLVISDPLSLSLWVLARDVAKFNNEYKSMVCMPACI